MQYGCVGLLESNNETPLHAQVDDAVEFIIDETFQVAGVGVVVAGTVKRGTLVQGASLLLGPHAGDASFKLTAIKSIAYKRLPVTKVILAILSLPTVACVAWYSSGRLDDGSSALSATGGCWTDCCSCFEAGQTVFFEEGKGFSTGSMSLCFLSARHPCSVFKCVLCRAWCWWTRPYIQRHPGSLMRTSPSSPIAPQLRPSNAALLISIQAL